MGAEPDGDAPVERPDPRNPHALVDEFLAQVARAEHDRRRSRVRRVAGAIGVRRALVGLGVVVAAVVLWPWLPGLSVVLLGIGLLAGVTWAAVGASPSAPTSHVADHGPDGNPLARSDPRAVVPPSQPGMGGSGVGV